ncbi:MAG: hypothetical protein QM743_06090 [Chitinophagaceae bacterium]
MIIILIGLIIGIVGYIMVNNVNLCLLELNRKSSRSSLVFFCILALVFEGAYCFCTLYMLERLMHYPLVIRIAQYLSIGFLFAIGLWTLLESSKQQEALQENIIRRGYWSVIIHPQQIPFWFFWGLLLIRKQLLIPDSSHFLLLSIANCAGSLIVFLLYIRYGNKLIERFRIRRNLLKNIVGVICLGSGVLLAVDILRSGT